MQLEKLLSLHQGVKSINPALKSLYPIAIVQQNQFLIYDLDYGTESYQFIKAAPLPMPIPNMVRAAFPISDYHEKIACVVTPEVFESLEGYATIFHEFVHCYQYETCEPDLKMQLDIARYAQETGNTMWEIEYPFPYAAQIFIRSYQAFLDAVGHKDLAGIRDYRKELRSFLGLHDFEYMVWQEWKEGYARWVENKIKEKFGLPRNTKGLAQPFTRVSFYAGGAAYIDYLSSQSPKVISNLPLLFKVLYSTYSVK